MPAWDSLFHHLNQLPEEQRGDWLFSSLVGTLLKIGSIRGERNVIFYASGFLQKAGAPSFATSITHEDLHGLMTVLYQMDCSKNLTFILHTPGGDVSATETLVDYLTSKFQDIEVIVPTMAMSAGTMISLASNRVIMGRQSQLGPTDPQMFLPSLNRMMSARAVVEQFERAKSEISQNVAVAHAWYPMLNAIGPSLIQDALNALDYSENVVAGWLQNRMLSHLGRPRRKAKKIAKHFNDASKHKSHGRRIGRDEARKKGVVVEDLEDDQDLQEHVLTAYHLVTLIFESSPTTKIMYSDAGRNWIKNFA